MLENFNLNSLRRIFNLVCGEGFKSKMVLCLSFLLFILITSVETFWTHKSGLVVLILISLSYFTAILFFGLLSTFSSQSSKSTTEQSTLASPLFPFIASLVLHVANQSQIVVANETNFVIGLLHFLTFKHLFLQSSPYRFQKWINVTVGFLISFLLVQSSVVILIIGYAWLESIELSKPEHSDSSTQTMQTSSFLPKHQEDIDRVLLNFVMDVHQPFLVLNWNTNQLEFVNKASQKVLPHLLLQDHYKLFDSFIIRSGTMSLSSTIKASCTSEKWSDFNGLEELFVYTTITNDRYFWLVNLLPLSKEQSLIGISMKDVTQIQESENKLAEEKYKGLISYSVAHEVKTPLNGLISFLEEIQTNISEEQQPQARCGLASAYLLQNRLNMMNDYIQIVSKKFELEIEAHSPSDIVHNVRSYMLNFIEDDKAKIEAEIGSGVPCRIYADRQRLETVLFHLVWNAGKYSQTENNAGLLVIRVDANKTAIAFSVSDNGKGIPDNKKKGLFRFRSREQVRRRRNEEEQKTGDKVLLSGLGLTICQMICKEMGTELKVESSVGKGTTFTFEISKKRLEHQEEIKEEDEDEELIEDESCLSLDFDDIREDIIIDIRMLPEKKKPRAFFVRKKSKRGPAARSYSVKTWLPNLNVLVVDDCLSNRVVEKTMVKKYNNKLNVDEAVNGLQAVAWIKEYNKDLIKGDVLILMDIEMPELDGIEATKKIRKLNLDMKVTIVAVTAFDSPEIREECIAAGMNYFYKKPFKYTDLQALMQKIKI